MYTVCSVHDSVMTIMMIVIIVTIIMLDMLAAVGTDLRETYI